MRDGRIRFRHETRTLREAERQQQQKEMATMNARAIVNDLKQVATVGLHLDELMVTASQARSLQATYESSGAPVPEWLTDANATLTSEIQTRIKGALELRLRELDQADAALKTNSERREDVRKERERIQRALGKAPEAAAEPVGAGQ